MRNAIVSKRYTANLLAALLLSAVAFKAAAAPLCAQVLRVPPTQEQISVMLNELARMALEGDLEKVSGTHRSLLQSLLNRKVTEAAEKLNVSKKEISAQLSTRIPMLQKIDSKKFQEDQRVRSEQKVEPSPRKPLRFHFEKDKSVNIYKKRYVGVTEIVDGRRAVIYMNRISGSKIFSLHSATGLTADKLIATNVFTAAVDLPRNRIAVIQTADMVSVSVHFYSLTDFKELSPAVKLDWNINTNFNLLVDSSLKIFPDGEHFILNAPTQYAIGSFKSPETIEITHDQLHGTFILDSHDYLTVSGRTLMRDRGGQKEYLELPKESRDIFHTISRYDEDQISIIGNKAIALVNLKTWQVSDSFEKQMGSIVLKNGFDGYVVGTKDHNLVMKLLDDDDSQATTIVDRSTIKSGSRFNQIYPFPDGKGFAAVARDNNTGYDWLYFFERDERQ